jgi:endonuclease III
VSLEHPTGEIADAHVDEAVVKAQAMLAELEPTTATEALLAAQMVGAQRAAMIFLARSLAPGQQVEMVDRHVNRAAKLMRLFNEQIEAMAKLKGKGGQQRVVVEHVTVAAGGQAIVGAVTQGWRGQS